MDRSQYTTPAYSTLRLAFIKGVWTAYSKAVAESIMWVLSLDKSFGHLNNCCCELDYWTTARRASRPGVRVPALGRDRPAGRIVWKRGIRFASRKTEEVALKGARYEDRPTDRPPSLLLIDCICYASEARIVILPVVGKNGGNGQKLVLIIVISWLSLEAQSCDFGAKIKPTFQTFPMCRQTGCLLCCGNGEDHVLHHCQPEKQKNQHEQEEFYLSVLQNVVDVQSKLVEEDQLDKCELKRWPTSTEVVEELNAIGRIAGPMVLTGLLLYSRAMISMLFLGYLGELELAGGSLSIGFANITGYSVISGLAMGMEPICGQAYGAKRWSLMGLTLQRTVLVLLCAAVPIGFLWLNMERILLWCGQDESITRMAGIFIVYSLPDLLAQAFLHPLRIYLRTQNITVPLTCCAAIALLLHVPINFLLVVYLKMGIRGVALAAVWTNFNLVFALLAYLWSSGVYRKSWEGLSGECLKGWRSLLSLAIPSCVSVCLEWWWYEFMIILCGLLINPKATVASMGILIQTTSLVYIFPSSLSFGVSTRVGNELGANRPAKARRAMIVALSCAVILGFLAMTFTITMRHVWARMFTDDQQIIALTSLALPIIGLCELGNCPQTTGCGVLRGTARPTIGANINLGSFYFVGMPVAIMMGFLLNFDFEGLWLGLLAAQASCVTLMLYVLLRTDWVLQAQRAKELTSCGVENDQVEEKTLKLTSCQKSPQTEMMNKSNNSITVGHKQQREHGEDTEPLITIKVVPT
eukprot:Gb_04836 [translate_table: standard]